MKVFDREEHRLAEGARQHGGNKEFDRSLPLSLRRGNNRLVLSVERDGKQRCDPSAAGKSCREKERATLQKMKGHGLCNPLGARSIESKRWLVAAEHPR